MLDEMVAAPGYTGTELGPYGFFPTDPACAQASAGTSEIDAPGVSSFPSCSAIPNPRESRSRRSVKSAACWLRSRLRSWFWPTPQSDERNRLSGRVPRDGSAGFNAAQWKNVVRVVEQAANVSAEFGLDLVFHPHVATYVETPEECERFFNATAHTGIGLCLDTGHCEYGGGRHPHRGSKVLERAKVSSH